MPEAYNGETRIHFEIAGAGPALLFIPGLGVGVRDLEALLKPLEEFATVVAVDNRGVGLSGMPDEPYSIELMASDAIAVLDAAGLERTDVLGYSMGGRIAIELALRCPERVNHLVLLATGARIVTTPQRRALFAVAPYLKLGANPRQPVYAFKRQRAASEGYDATGRLGAIDAETLIVHGRSDRIATPALAEELEAGIPNSRIEWYEGGHMGPMIKPAPIAHMVRDFVR